MIKIYDEYKLRRFQELMFFEKKSGVKKTGTAGHMFRKFPPQNAQMQQAVP